ncbi:MAG: L,D-transpeptidase [Spirochaetota bacterium]
MKNGYRYVFLGALFAFSVHIFGVPVLDKAYVSDIAATAAKRYGYDGKRDLIIVDVESQRLFLIKNGRIMTNYGISSSRYGEGARKLSYRTPLGFHKVYDKAGAHAKVGMIFEWCKATGRISPIFTDAVDKDIDPVLTRILVLDGLEPGVNKGGDVDSRSRGIYIHGTHEEGLIGRKASHGCIRMRNADVIALFNAVPIGTIVYMR